MTVAPHDVLSIDGAELSVSLDLTRCAPPTARDWDRCVAPLLHAYRELVARHGRAAAAHIFDRAPVAGGHPRIDAAVAALAEHLAHRDGWPRPDWTREDGMDGGAARRADPAEVRSGAAGPRGSGAGPRGSGAGSREDPPVWWFVSPRRGPHGSALMESPPAFRRRAVFVRADELA